MVNHFRTILLNKPGPLLPGPEALDEYIPPFTAIDIPAPLAQVNQVLFGDCVRSGDYLGRVNQLLLVVENSDMAHYTTKEDQRKTTCVVRDLQTDPAKDITLLFPLTSIQEMPESVATNLLGRDTELMGYYAESGTFVDKLAAIVVGYVEKLESYHV